MLAGNEVCDCYRSMRSSKLFNSDERSNLVEILSKVHDMKDKTEVALWALAVENRRYYDQVWNITVIFIQAFGTIAYPRGHASFLDAQHLDCIPGSCSSRYTFHYALHEFLMKIPHHFAVTHVVLNYGLWKSSFTNMETRLIAETARLHWQVKFIWKQTTPLQHGPMFHNTKAEARHRELFQLTGWRHLDTLTLIRNHSRYPHVFLDNTHFVGSVYQMLNEHLVHEFI